MKRTLCLSIVAVLAACTKSPSTADAGVVAPPIVAPAPAVAPVAPPIIVSAEALDGLNMPLSLSRVQVVFPKRDVGEREEVADGKTLGTAYDVTNDGRVDVVVHAGLDRMLASAEVVAKDAADARGIRVGDPMGRALDAPHDCVRGTGERAGTVACWAKNERRIIYVARPTDDKSWGGADNEDVPADVLARLPITALVWSPASK